MPRGSVERWAGIGWILVLSLGWPVAGRGDLVRLGAGDGRVELGRAAERIPDREGKLGPEDLLAGEAAGRSRPSPNSGAGLLKGTVWFRVEIQADAGKEWRLAYEMPLVERLDVFLRGSGRREHLVGGLGVPLEARSIDHRGPHHVHALTLEAGERVTLLVRAETRGVTHASLAAYQRAALASRERWELASVAFDAGVLAVLIVIAVLGFCALRDGSSPRFAGVLLCFAGYEVSWSGLAAAWLFPESPRWALAAPSLFGAGCIAFSLSFARSFMATTERRSFLDPMTRALAWSAILPAAIAPFRPDWASTATALLGAATFLLGSAVAVEAVAMRRRAARFFLVAWCLVLVGGLPLMLALLDLVPSNAFTLQGLRVAVWLAALVLLLGFGDELRRRSRRSREELEHAVAERTRELERAVAEMQVEVGERRRAEEARDKLQAGLQQAAKMEAIGQLAGGVAHDFNNLLTVMTTSASLGLADLSERHPVRPYFQDIQAAALRAAQLTRQLLAFSRRQVIEPRPISLASQVEGMRSMLTRLLGEDMVLSFDLARDLPPVIVDPSQLEQIVINLAVNARDASRAGGRIVISTRARHATPPGGERPLRFGVLSVADDGHGMSPDVKARIFDPFFTTKQQKGTGLGLATVYGIAIQHGGFVEVDSAPGKGAAFHVFLPEASAACAGAEPPPADRRLSQGSGTVLLAEDEEMVRDSTRGFLEKLGYDVLPARDGADALALCARHTGPIHVLLTDVVMPHLNGQELADQAVASRPGLQVIYMSGYPQDAIAQDGFLQSGLRLVSKPYDPGQLAQALSQAMARVASPRLEG